MSYYSRYGEKYVNPALDEVSDVFSDAWEWSADTFNAALDKLLSILAAGAGEVLENISAGWNYIYWWRTDDPVVASGSTLYGLHPRFPLGSRIWADVHPESYWYDSSTKTGGFYVISRIEAIYGVQDWVWSDRFSRYMVFNYREQLRRSFHMGRDADPLTGASGRMQWPSRVSGRIVNVSGESQLYAGWPPLASVDGDVMWGEVVRCVTRPDGDSVVFCGSLDDIHEPVCLPYILDVTYGLVDVGDALDLPVVRYHYFVRRVSFAGELLPPVAPFGPEIEDEPGGEPPEDEIPPVEDEPGGEPPEGEIPPVGNEPVSSRRSGRFWWSLFLSYLLIDSVSRGAMNYGFPEVSSGVEVVRS